MKETRSKSKVYSATSAISPTPIKIKIPVPIPIPVSSKYTSRQTYYKTSLEPQRCTFGFDDDDNNSDDDLGDIKTYEDLWDDDGEF